jgi:hypothetical protein
MMVEAFRRIKARVRAKLAGFMENPLNSYIFLTDEAKEVLAMEGVQFAKVYNCMQGGSRFKITGVVIYGVKAPPQLKSVCRNINGICDRTGQPHDSIRPEVVNGRVTSFPTEEEAEYPLLLCECFAAMTKAFLEENPEARSRCEHDFLEIYSGPNAPTTAAVVKALRSEPDLAAWFDAALRHNLSLAHYCKMSTNLFNLN